MDLKGNAVQMATVLLNGLSLALADSSTMQEALNKLQIDKEQLRNLARAASRVATEIEKIASRPIVDGEIKR